VRRALIALALLLAAACGTTTPMTTTSTAGSGSELSGTTGGGTTGSSLGGSTTGSSLGGTTGGALPGGTPTQSGPTSSTTTGGTTTGPSSAPTQGGARLRTALKIGVATVDLGAAVKALGGSSESNKRADDGYRAVITGLNLTGGLSGRRLVPTYYVIDATSGSYQQDSASACAKFRESKIEVLVTDAASTDYGFYACIAKAGIPMISSVPTDAKGYASSPWLFNAFTPSYDRGYGAVVDQLLASGYLTTKNKIGVVRIECTAITSAYQNSVLRRMRAAHLATPIEYTVPCAAGFQDAASYSAAMQSAVLRFRSSAVDRVFVLGSQENLLLQYFAEQAQSQGYHPGYALSSGSLPYTLIGASTFPAQQLPQVHGVGWHPQGDTGVDPKLAPEKRCVSLATKGGLKPANISEAYVLNQACSNLFLLGTAVERGTGSATGPALRATIPTLGSSFLSTGIINAATQYGPGRPDGPQLARAWGYVDSCGCFRYSSAARVMI
jgi:hypothetical protein